MSKNEETTAVKKQEPIVDMVLTKVNSLQDLGQLHLPENYSAANALKAAHLVLSDMTNKDGKPVLENTTKASQANALLKMVTLGLNPLKNQGSFIPYGDKLTWQTEYAGKMAIAKRDAGVNSIVGQVVYEGDDFKYNVDIDSGRMHLVSHDTSLSNIDMNKIIGAYAIVTLEDGVKHMTVMTIGQIKQSWMQGATKGNSPAHKNFPDQMSLKTVFNRALKPFVNSSSDEHLFGGETSSDHVKTESDKKVGEEQAAEDISFEEVTDDKKEETPKAEESAMKPNADF